MDPVVPYHDVTAGVHQDWVDELSPKGWRPIALNVSGDPADPRYAAVWVQRQGPGWRAIHDVAEQDYQARLADIVAQGFEPAIVSATGPAGRAVFAAVFVAGEPALARHGLRWGKDTDPDTVNQVMKQAFDSRLIPRSIAVYGTVGDPRVAGVWAAAGGRLWSWYWSDDAGHQRIFTAERLGGQHPGQVAVGYGQLLSVYNDDRIGLWSARHGMTAGDYQVAIDQARAAGQQPIAVQAGDLGPPIRYAATFAADDLQRSRHWQVKGPLVPGQGDLDTIFSRAMKRYGIRAATVAVARAGTAYLTRAYTWAEDEWPATTPSTTFRAASVSKAFTCAAIQLLSDTGVINLDASVFSYLGLASNQVPPDPHDAITIRQCATGLSGLPRDFQGSGLPPDPDGNITFREVGISVGHMASVRELAALAYRIPLAYPPGMPPPGLDTYSNLAFHVLGAVVEQASGQGLVDFVNQRLAAPMGITDIRAGATGLGLRHPGEIGAYDSAGVGLSKLDLRPDVLAPAAYGGSLLLDSAPGSGGLVTSAETIARFIGTHAAWDLGGRVTATRYGDFAGTAAAAVSNGVWDVSFLVNRALDKTPADAMDPKDALRDEIVAWLATHGSKLSPFHTGPRFPIRGVLLAGKFRTQAELNVMSKDDMRNTLIVELTNRSNQTNYQAYDNDTLAGMGAVLVFLRQAGIRDDATLRTLSADDQRNIAIVEIDAQTGVGQALQGLTDLELAQVVLGSDRARRGQVPGLVSSWVRGVLLLGGFRTQHELNAMSREDMRNTLIVELTNRTNQTNYQAYNEAELEGLGAVLVLVRALGLRSDAALETMSADEVRNTLIVALDAQTKLGRDLQGLTNLELVLVALTGTTT